MRATLAWLALLAVGCAPSPPAAVAAEVACVPEESPLRQRCRVRLTDRRTGRPVAGATVTLTADMPSMPLAHGVTPVPARPGPEPGTYQATVQLEMPGRWVVAARIEGPVRDQVTHAIDVAR
jgi:YtkA-like